MSGGGGQVNTFWQVLLAKFGGAANANVATVEAHESADPNDVTSINEPAVNTAAVITFAAPGAGFRLVVKAIYAWYTGAAGPAAGGNLLLESPAGTTKARIPVAVVAADSLIKVDRDIHGGTNQPVVVTLPAGAVGASGKLYVTVVKEREVAA